MTYDHVLENGEEKTRARIAGIVFGFLGFIVWFAAGAAALAIDVPYQFFFENTIDNSYLVVTGIQTTTSATPLITLFIGMGFICLGWTVIAIIAGLLSDVAGRLRERRETK